MKMSPPPTRRRFRNDWDHILYLYRRALFWFYNRGLRHKAAAFCDSLEGLLKKQKDARVSIKGQECWSLIREIHGNLPRAIYHREREIRLIKHYQLLAPNRNDYTLGDLADRLDLLAILFRENGDVAHAISTLRESQALCLQAGIAFDGQILLLGSPIDSTCPYL